MSPWFTIVSIVEFQAYNIPTPIPLQVSTAFHYPTLSPSPYHPVPTSFNRYIFKNYYGNLGSMLCDQDKTLRFILLILAYFI